MNQTRWEQAYSSIRHVMTTAGGVLVALGLTDEVAVSDMINNLTVAAGALSGVVGWAWGVYDKVRSGRQQYRVPPITPPVK